jgi:hypothetical protein
METHVRELTDGQLDEVCAGSFGAFRFLSQVFASKANSANADLAAAADHQRQANDRMAQLRGLQAQLGDLQIG